MRQTSIKFNGREVTNPLARKGVVVMLFTLLPIMFVVGLLVLFFIGLPLALLTDLPLKALGRRGNLRGNGQIVLDHASFQRKGSPLREPGLVGRTLWLLGSSALIVGVIWMLFF